MSEEKSKKSIPTVLASLLVLLSLALVLNAVQKYLGPKPPGPQSGIPSLTSTEPPASTGTPLSVTPEPGEVIEVVSGFKGFKKFVSEQDFKEYAQRNREEGYYGLGAGFGMRGIMLLEEARAVSAPTPAPTPGEATKQLPPAAEPERISETNVQVIGIDEPDIVKTNGKEIYFSSHQGYYPVRWSEGETMSPSPSGRAGETKIIKAFPPAALAKTAGLDKTGDLLLKDNTLVVFSGEKLYGYDVSDPKNPREAWQAKLEDNHYLVGARLFQDNIYLITRQNIGYNKPCPIRPLSVDPVKNEVSNGVEARTIEIRCVDVFHPVVDTVVDVTYTVLALNLASGAVKDNVSFVGRADSSLVYMSEQGLYVTYSIEGDFVKFFYNFLIEKAEGLVSETVKEKLRKLVGYDISESSKLAELQIILNNYYNSLSDDERLKTESEFNNRLQDYYKEQQRELEKTGIVKLSVGELKVVSIGEVPGKPLNQFSLDEYQENLRIAVTIGQQWSMFGRLGESVSDVYVLDDGLKVKGSVKDLGKGERIYSVRFLEDKGYVVTFKQIDPFFVLDLSDPNKPELRGELKIPGYSSYLHPITKDKILGIGKEGQNVKISLFDVANPSQPTEKAKYNLDEYWSEILNNYHGFLLDTKHGIFFLPANKAGYVFSYQGDGLKLQRVVSGVSAKRAIYINDYLYIIGDDKIIVLNELDWEKVNELEL